MINYSLGNMESQRATAAKTKESLKKKKPTKKKPLSKAKCGLENPCVFGKHNPNFDNTKSL